MEPADLDIGLEDLIQAVEGFRPDGDDVDRLRTAVTFAERLGDLGDQLVGTFVDRARRSGASWREIGDGLGVSKQAAQKRFVSAPGEERLEGFLSRFTPRAREVLTVARDTARRLGQTQVRTEHLVIGLIDDPEGLSARALAAQGLVAAEVRAAVDAASPAAAQSLPAHIPFAAEGKKVLENALREAFSRRHNYIGTEHLLLGLLAERRSAGAKVLRRLGVTQDATAEWLDTALADLVAKKRSGG